MRKEEKSAASFLRGHFEAEPRYEPLGPSKPPDFGIRNIAFEVRRLNENFVSDDGQVEGLEVLDHRLTRAVTGELKNIPFSPEKGSFGVLLRYSRERKPQPARIAKIVARGARDHYASGLRKALTIRANGVEATLVPLSTPRGRAFMRPIAFDQQGGGMVADIYQRNIQIALNEKIRKTRSIATAFDYWCLVLVDSILPEISWTEELGQLEMEMKHFRAVVVIGPDGGLLMEYPQDALRKCARQRS